MILTKRLSLQSMASRTNKLQSHSFTKNIQLSYNYPNHRRRTSSFFFSTKSQILQREKRSSHDMNDQYEGYKLNVRQKKALKLVNDQTSTTTTTTNENSNNEVDIEKVSDISQALKVLKEQAEIQDIESYENNPQPWYNLLTLPSRALWRSSPKSPPTYITETQMDIMKRSERTSKQLRRTIENIVHNQTVLSEKRERERRDLVNNGGRSSGGGDGNMRDSDTSLNTKARKAAENRIKPVYYKPEQTVSSLKYRLVPNYQVTKRILREVQGLIGRENFQPKKVLDVGIGVGSSSAALLDHSFERFMRENVVKDDDENDDDELDLGMQPSYSYDGVEWVHGIDPSTSMRDGAKIVLESVIEGQQKEILEAENDGTLSRIPTKPRITFGEALSSTPHRDISQSRGTYDLALCSYTLCEIPSVIASLSLGAMIFEKLSPNGIAIFIEPGTPDGFNSLRSIRSMLLDCCPPISDNGDVDDENEVGDEECHVIAPCTHNGTCPMIRHKRNFKKKKSQKVEMDEAVNVEGEEDNSNMDEIDEDLWSEEEIGAIDEIDDDDINHGWDEEDDDEFDSIESSSLSTETNAFDSAFCSFIHGLPGGEGGKRGEKFSYLVVQKRITGEFQFNVAETDPFRDVNIIDMLQSSIDAGGVNAPKRGSKIVHERSRDEDKLQEILEDASDIERQYLHSEEDLLGLELVKGKYNSWGRIVRAPIKKKGHVIVDYCTASHDVDDIDDDDDHNQNQPRGKIIRRTVTKGQSERAAPGMYMASRKSRWGGLWPNV